jgi:hypothetical protein
MRAFSSSSHAHAIAPVHTAGVGLVVKALVVALLTLPVVAYVTGSLVGARSELPAQREPVLIGERVQVEPRQTIRPEPTRRPDPESPADADDSGDRGDSDDPDDDDSVSVVRPQPRDIDDDADDRDDGPDDDSGEGRSGDDGD